MNSQDVYNIVKDHNKKVDDYIEKQQEFNKNISVLIARHDEKIKGLWKIPLLSGGIVGLIVAIGTFISFLH